MNLQHGNRTVPWCCILQDQEGNNKAKEGRIRWEADKHKCLISQSKKPDSQRRRRWLWQKLPIPTDRQYVTSRNSKGWSQKDSHLHHKPREYGTVCLQSDNGRIGCTKRDVEPFLHFVWLLVRWRSWVAVSDRAMVWGDVFRWNCLALLHFISWHRDVRKRLCLEEDCSQLHHQWTFLPAPNCNVPFRLCAEHIGPTIIQEFAYDEDGPYNQVQLRIHPRRNLTQFDEQHLQRTR